MEPMLQWQTCYAHDGNKRETLMHSPQHCAEMGLRSQTAELGIFAQKALVQTRMTAVYAKMTGIPRDLHAFS